MDINSLVQPNGTVELFQHEPLNKNERTIRLVQLTAVYTGAQSEDGDWRIECHFQRFKIDELPEYVALSYEWGADKPSIASELPVISRGLPIPTSDNLRAFFRRIVVSRGSGETRSRPSDGETFKFVAKRDFDGLEDDPIIELGATKQSDGGTGEEPQGLVCWLFIDQLCINQKSIEERSHQVMMMGNVFERSWGTLAWLGDDLPDETECWTTVYCPNVLLERSYFKRLWIIQELMLPKNVTVRLRNLCKSWRALIRTVNFDDVPKSQNLVHTHFEYLLWKLDHGRGDSWRDLGLDWADLLPLSSDALCLDPRDRIYGMLGLVDPKLKMQPDYRVETIDLAAQVWRKQLPKPPLGKLQGWWCSVNHLQDEGIAKFTSILCKALGVGVADLAHRLNATFHQFWRFFCRQDGDDFRQSSPPGPDLGYCKSYSMPDLRLPCRECELRRITKTRRSAISSVIERIKDNIT